MSLNVGLVKKTSHYLMEILMITDAAILSASFTQLTDRERDVLVLMAEGLSNRAIAQKLFVTVRTAENYVGSVLLKLVGPAEPDSHINRRVTVVAMFLNAGRQ
jgi:DNA-binding NarL/FixJ family response regulator